MTDTISTETANRIRQRAHAIAAVEYDAPTARRFERTVRDYYSTRETIPDLFAEKTQTWVRYLDRAAYEILGVRPDGLTDVDAGRYTYGPNDLLVREHVRAVLDLYA